MFGFFNKPANTEKVAALIYTKDVCCPSGVVKTRRFGATALKEKISTPSGVEIGLMLCKMHQLYRCGLQSINIWGIPDTPFFV